MSEELAPVPLNEGVMTMAPSNTLMAELMSDEVIESSDIVLPKILLMQSTSQMVHDEKASPGDLRDSLNNSLMGNKEKALDVIFFYHTKSWVINEMIDGKWEFKERVPYTVENSVWRKQWEDTIDGVQIRRDESIDLYCALPGEIEKGTFLPYLISFRRTSYLAGKKILTTLETLRMGKKRRPLASVVFSVLPEKKQTDKGTFHVLNVTRGRETTDVEMQAILPWFRLVKASGVKVDDSDLHSEAQQPASVQPQASADNISF